MEQLPIFNFDFHLFLKENINFFIKKPVKVFNYIYNNY